MTATEQAAEEINALRPRLKALGMTRLAIVGLMLDLSADDARALLAEIAQCLRPRVKLGAANEPNRNR
jgi:hypothetical protein